MPCWYYDKKALRSTPSCKDGIDYETEARYRREGARFILDCGSKMGLRFDTCASGVIYYHRFYMFHSFRDFPRHVMAACSLFLAGKVEETPKKCKDIIKTVRGMLTDQQFMVFGEDPKEEVMTMERILLQTIKFDLQVQHPYQFLLKYAKHLRGEKGKVQNMIQMAWTFVNDSLCTSLGILWEPEVISVALLYLASRLSKVDITDWVGKTPGTKAKWWEQFIGDVSMELLEEICHEVLDLYSSQAAAAKAKHEESPPPPPPSLKPREPPAKKSRPSTPVESPSKSRKITPENHESRHVHEQLDNSSNPPAPHNSSTPHGPPVPQRGAAAPTAPPAGHGAQYGNGFHGDDFTQFNPYVSQGMYASSFMSQEGSQNIRSLMGGGGSGAGGGGAQRPENYNQGGNYQQPATSGYQQNPPPGQYPTGVQPQYQQPQYPQGSYPPQAGAYSQGQSQYNHQQQQQPQQPYSQAGYNTGYPQPGQGQPPPPQGYQQPPPQQTQQQYGQNTQQQQQYGQYQNTYNQGYNPAGPPPPGVRPPGPPPGAPPRQAPQPPGSNGPPGTYNEHYQQQNPQQNYNYNHAPPGGYDYNASRGGAPRNSSAQQGSHQSSAVATVRITGRR